MAVARFIGASPIAAYNPAVCLNKGIRSKKGIEKLRDIMSMNDLAIFLVASFFLWITPGQDTIYIVARSISQGRLVGVVSSLGIGTGSLVHSGLAAAGISLVILTSPLLFLFIKVSGCLYLVYLGISAICSNSNQKVSLSIEHKSLSGIYAQGVATNLLNPKVALFFIAFLPQFASSDGAKLNLLFLGATFVVGGTVWCLMVAYFASSFSEFLSDSKIISKWFGKMSGAIYIGLGLNILRAKA